MPQRKELPDELALMFEREGLRPEMDAMGPRLTMKMSGELYMAVANYRRKQFIESRPQAEQEKLANELLFD